MNDVGWHARDQEIPLDSLAEQFFEPGLLARYLDEKLSFGTKVPANVTEGIAIPPKVEIDLPDAARAAGKPFTVLVVVTDQGGGIDQVRLYHNGKSVQPGSLMQQREVEAKGQRIRVVAFQVKPVPGINTFRGVATALWGMKENQPRDRDIYGRWAAAEAACCGRRHQQVQRSRADAGLQRARCEGDRGSDAARCERSVLRRGGARPLRQPGDAGQYYCGTEGTDRRRRKRCGRGLSGRAWHRRRRRLDLPAARSQDAEEFEDYRKGVIMAHEMHALVAAQAQRVLVMIDSPVRRHRRTFERQQNRAALYPELQPSR
jgi:hypothetical protein